MIRLKVCDAPPTLLMVCPLAPNEARIDCGELAPFEVRDSGTR